MVVTAICLAFSLAKRGTCPLGGQKRIVPCLTFQSTPLGQIDAWSAAHTPTGRNPRAWLRIGARHISSAVNTSPVAGPTMTRKSARALSVLIRAGRRVVRDVSALLTSPAANLLPLSG